MSKLSTDQSNLQTEAHASAKLAASADSAGDEETPASPKSEDTPAELHAAHEEVLAADAQVRDLQFGYVSHYKLPFSRQVRDEIRSAFPCDEAIFNQADQAELKVANRYLLLRATTFFTFLVFLGIAYDAAAAHLGFAPRFTTRLGGPWLPFGESLAEVALTIALAGSGLVAVRWLIRAFFLTLLIERIAEKFAHAVSQRYSDVQTLMFEAANNIRDRMGPISWVESGNMWAKAALWQAKRAEYLDRYSTTIAWKNRMFFLILEALSFLLKLILAGAVAAVIWSAGEAGFAFSLENAKAKAALSALVLGFTVVGWGYVLRKQGDFWTKAFTKEINLDAPAQSHYYNTIPNIIANLIATILSNERGRSG